MTWIDRALLALALLGAGASKLAGEAAGAIGVLVPRLSALAATGLALLMVGATITCLFVLRAPPSLPLGLLVVAALVAWSGWSRVLTPHRVP